LAYTVDVHLVVHVMVFATMLGIVGTGKQSIVGCA